jgi:hypothetical protein
LFLPAEDLRAATFILALIDDVAKRLACLPADRMARFAAEAGATA